MLHVLSHPWPVFDVDISTDGREIVTSDRGNQIRIWDTTSGNELAVFDAMPRGPGDFFGTMQSGYPALKVANIIRDESLLVLAKKEASLLLDSDPFLDRYPALRGRINRFWKGRVDLYKTA